MNTILDPSITEETWNSLCKQMHLTYTVKSSSGDIVELFPGGKDILVSWGDRMNFIDMMYEVRMKEFDSQMDAVCT